MTENVDVMKAGVEACRIQTSLLYAATAANVDAMGALAKENDLPLAVKADSVEALVPLTEKLTGMGLKDLVLDPGSREVKQAFEDQVAIRRAALKAATAAVGFPTITFPCEMASNTGYGNPYRRHVYRQIRRHCGLSDLPAKAFSRCCWSGSTSSPTRSGP
jgi:acetyl-CoA decarbonylase/synthase, CODH/ACS complex subunit gamma